MFLSMPFCVMRMHTETSGLGKVIYPTTVLMHRGCVAMVTSQLPPNYIIVSAELVLTLFLSITVEETGAAHDVYEWKCACFVS